MSSNYPAWRVPSSSLDYLGQASRVNPGPGTAATAFHGNAAETELGVHGVYDSPEETAQTSPSTVTISCKIGTREQLLEQERMLRSLDHQAVLICSDNANAVQVIAATKESFSVVRTQSESAAGSGGDAYCVPAAVLSTAIAADRRMLVSLLPTDAATNALIHRNAHPNSPGCRYPILGVLLSVVVEKSNSTLHVTLAVEHATEIVLPVAAKAHEYVAGDLVHIRVAHPS